MGETSCARRSGAHHVVAALEADGTEVVFGIPGGAILPVYDPLMDSEQIRHVLVRHEQDAGHAAEGYALATGRVGVCMATSGPGATNLVTPLADAYMDSVPLVAITGQVNASQLGTDAFQEADICGMTMPITKHSFLVERAADIGPSVARAFEIASSGRPGPVLVDIAKSALVEETGGVVEAPDRVELPLPDPPRRTIDWVIDELSRAQRPVLYVGGGAIRSEASGVLADLVELTGIPFVTTLMARGVLPDTHPMNLGMPGMHGTVPAVAALQLSDLVIAVGARFDDRVTGNPKSFAPDARVVHVDIDPAEIGKNRFADVPIVGDCRRVVELINDRLRRCDPTPDYSAWRSRLAVLAERYPVGFETSDDGSLAPQHVLRRLGALAREGTIFTSGVGQHQMWASQFLGFKQPRTWLNSGGLGTMGFSVPAAMGAKLGRPEVDVWSIDGDGCFQMTGRELATCAIEQIPIKVALINNGSLGMVRQLQTLFYDERVNNVSLSAGERAVRIPDFVLMAEALGCVGLSCETADEVDSVITKALEIDDAPVVIDFRVRPEELVWPTIAAGASNDDLQYARGLCPDFDSFE